MITVAYIAYLSIEKNFVNKNIDAYHNYKFRGVDKNNKMKKSYFEISFEKIAVEAKSFLLYIRPNMAEMAKFTMTTEWFDHHQKHNP